MAGNEYTRGGGLVVKKYLEIQKGVNNLRFDQRNRSMFGHSAYSSVIAIVEISLKPTTKPYGLWFFDP